MKLLFTTMILFLTLLSNLLSGIDVDEVKEKLAMVQNTENSGRDFWFTIPPVYEDGSSANDNFIKILVTSTSEAKVKVSVDGKGLLINKTITPNSIISFDLTPTLAQAILHSGRSDKARPAQVYKNAAIHVESDLPIIVYVVVDFYYSSDGFFAIPTHAFGTKYINSAYKEPDLGTQGWMSPFTGIVAAYDNTNIKFTMGGGDQFDDAVPFDGGDLVKPGESKSTILSKGDVWLLSINGKRQDLSGSIFEGDKPFAIVSGVHCANIPLGVSSCDYIVNMEFPVKFWHKDYFITPNFYKTYNGIVRIYASEENTSVYRNGTFLVTITKGGGAILGEGFIETRLWPKHEGLPIPPRLACISANKPIQIVYYNTGSTEDSQGGRTDPFMMQIPAIEQSTKHSILFSPTETNSNHPFDENIVNITFPLSNNQIPNDLLFAELPLNDEKPVFRKLKDVFDDTFNKFETTYNGKNYASKYLNITSKGSYIIKSDSTKFLTQSFGFSNFESYGFPTSFSLNDQSKNDISAPFIMYSQQCNGDILLEDGIVSDLPEDEASRSNIEDVYVMASENYEFEWKTKSGDFIPGTNKDLNWSLTVIDKSKSASALLYFSDRAGNDTTIYVEYTKPNYEISSSKFELMNPNINTLTFQDTLRNKSATSDLNITRVEIPNQDSPFKITSFEGDWIPGTPIPPLEERYINISFEKDELENNTTYSDSLFIGIGVEKDGELTECQFFSITELNSSIYFPDYYLAKGNDFGEFNEKVKSRKLADTIRNLSANAPLYVSRLEFQDGDKGYSIGGFTPFNWNTTMPIEPLETVIIDVLFSSAGITQGDESIVITDSLGIGISAFNSDNELEEIEFNYVTEQKAIVKAKEVESSVTPEQTLSEYIIVTQSKITILPKAISEGFSELSIFNLEGNKVISSDMSNMNISISSLQSGTYIITLQNEDRLLTRKINVVK